MIRKPLEIRPLAGAIGAEIFGVDLAHELDGDTIAAIRQAWLDHLVIFFRDQNLTPAQLLAFARRFGEPIEYPFVKGLDGFPEITPVVKLEHERSISAASGIPTRPISNARRWARCCSRARCRPMAATRCSPTCISPTRPCRPGMRRLLDGLVAVNSSAKADVTKTREDRMRDGATRRRAARIRAEHPVVRTHPETGRKALYVNGGHTRALQGHDRGGKRAAARFLFAHQTRPEFTCRFRWDVGSLAFWDNRCAQHNPINDYHGYPPGHAPGDPGGRQAAVKE